MQTTEVEIEETVVIQEVSRAPKPGVVTVTADLPAAPPAEHEPQDQKVKIEEEAAVVEEISPAKPEKASSDSESEEEAEYHPNVPASISQSQIPEEKEEEEEQMKEEEEEQKQVSAPVVPSLPVEASQPAELMSQEEEESKKEEMQVEEKKDDQEEKESGRETEDSTDDPMVTPEEEPEGLVLPEESAEAGPTEEPEQPKMNGEASLVEVDPRPQVICCSEVKPTAELLQGFEPSCQPQKTPTSFPAASHIAGFLFLLV